MLLDGDVNPNMPCSSMLELYLLEVRFKSNAGTESVSGLCWINVFASFPLFVYFSKKSGSLTSEKLGRDGGVDGLFTESPGPVFTLQESGKSPCSSFAEVTAWDSSMSFRSPEAGTASGDGVMGD